MVEVVEWCDGQHMTGCLNCLIIRMDREPERFVGVEVGCPCGAMWEPTVERGGEEPCPDCGSMVARWL
jgi:hypothetical protein